MIAAVVNGPGLTPRCGYFAEPEAGHGEVLVDVSAAALSPLVRARAAGVHYSAAPLFPFVAGVDGVGRLASSERVYFLLPRAPFGSFAERTVIADNRWVAVPDEIDDVSAAGIANPGMSSWAALTERARIARGDTVLINGATGASGRLAVAIARHLGASRVIATGRNAAVLAGLDADATILLADDELALVSAFREQFAIGVDIILDYLWGPTAEALLLAATEAWTESPPIRFVQIGSVSSAEIRLPAAVLRSRAIELSGSGLGSLSVDRLLAAVAQVFKHAFDAKLKLELTAVPLVEVDTSWKPQGRTTRQVYQIPNQN